MPGAYTHFTVARSTISTLPSTAQRVVNKYPYLYFFGAQGADFCFFYPVFKSFRKSDNFGSFLHRKGGYKAFCVCKAFATDERSLAYALGFITHYAADTVFHPYVYATAGSSAFRHSRVEAALDGYFHCEAAENADEYGKYFGKAPPEKQTNELFLLYAAIAAKTDFPPLEKGAFFRAVKLFNAYLPLPNAVFGNKRSKLRDALTNAENREWAHPQTKERSTDGAKELFEKTLRRNQTLTESFLSALKNRTPLSPALFGKNYLSGL